MKERLILRSSGIYIVRDTLLFSGTEKDNRSDTDMLLSYIDEMKGVPDPEEYMETKFDKIPADTVKGILGTIRQFPKTETLFVLYYNPVTHKWNIQPLSSHASGAAVGGTANLDKVPAGFMYVGTVHTHPEMGAFWSGTDHKDQDMNDGFHVVLGLKNGHVEHSLATLFTKFGNEFEFEVDDLFDMTGVDFKEDYEPDQELLKSINEQNAAVKIKPIIPTATFLGRPYHFGGEINTTQFGWHNIMDGSLDAIELDSGPDARVRALEIELERVKATVNSLASSKQEDIVDAVINALSGLQDNLATTDEQEIADNAVRRLDEAGIPLQNILAAVASRYEDTLTLEVLKADLDDIIQDIDADYIFSKYAGEKGGK